MNIEILNYLSAITEEEQSILDGITQIRQELYSGGHDFIIDSRRMPGSGRYVSIRPHTRFAPFPLHKHNYIEMMYMLSGSTTHIVDGICVRLEKGDLLILNQHCRHEIMSAGIDDIGVNFIILPEFLNSVFEKLDFENRFIKALCKKTSAHLHFMVSEYLPVQNVIENLLWSLISENDSHKILQSTMQLLFMLLADCTETLASSQNRHDTLLAEISRYIDSSYQTATLSELAGNLHHSQSNMSKLIYKATGKTFKELLKEKRLDIAEGLLLKSNVSVTDIISAAGYDNTGYFYRIFKERFGVSPKDYRKLKGK